MQIIYTDGSCRPTNPGPGGWAAVFVSDKRPICLTGGEEWTTNNRMELTAAIEALTFSARHSKIHIITDSRYVSQGITSWIDRWEQEGWCRDIKNKDLWIRLRKLTKSRQVTWEWTRSHCGTIYNELADRAAKEAVP